MLSGTGMCMYIYFGKFKWKPLMSLSQKAYMPFFPPGSKRCCDSIVTREGKKAQFELCEIPLPIGSLCHYATGEVKSLVLRCRSCIKNTRSSFPGVREPCEVGWLSHFQVKIIKATGTLRTTSSQPKHSIKEFRKAFSWQTKMRSNVWPCQVVIWGKSWKGRASIFNVYPKERNDFHFTHTKKMSKCYSEVKLVVI